MVYVNPEFRGNKIGEKLLEKFFNLVDNERGYLDISSFTEDGNKYLKKTIDKLKIKYKNIVW